MITTQDIVVTRRGNHLLNKVSVAIHPGEVLGIIGPNGAGKSTLLKVLTGEMEPDSGIVSLDGQDIHKLSPSALANRRGVLPQQTQIAFPFTVEEIVALGRTFPGNREPKSKTQQICNEALALVDMQPFLERDYTTLSGGEQRRVQLARVLAQLWDEEKRANSFLLLDEPLAGLDPAHQQSCLALANKWAKAGTGVTIVIHDLNQAIEYTDRILLLNRGQIAFYGLTKELLANIGILETVFNIQVKKLTDPDSGQITLRLDHHQQTSTTMQHTHAAKSEEADPQAILQKAQSESDALVSQAKSIVLGTTDGNNRPEASYAPFYQDEENNFYVYLSAMSKHFHNLKANPAVSVLFIEDEGTSRNLFARKRLTIQSKAEIIARDTDNFTGIMGKFKDRFGPIMDRLIEMTDFELFKLAPVEGSLVIGFGRAFRVSPDLKVQDHRNDQGHQRG